jgi:hypothetical protein
MFDQARTRNGVFFLKEFNFDVIYAQLSKWNVFCYNNLNGTTCRLKLQNARIQNPGHKTFYLQFFGVFILRDCRGAMNMLIRAKERIMNRKVCRRIGCFFICVL